MKLTLLFSVLLSSTLLFSQTRFLKHTVLPGETIYTIASKYGTDAKFLLMLNNLPDNIRLSGGDVVLIRELKPGEEPAKETRSFIEKSEYQPVKTEVAKTETKAAASETTSAPHASSEVKKAAAASSEVINYNGTGYSVTNSGVHTVEKGQTFYRISVIYGISVDKLKEMNGLTNTNISVGQKLKVPVR